MKLKQITPINGEVIGEYSLIESKEVIDGLIDKSYKSYLSWKEVSFSERAKLLNKLAEVIRENAGEIAKLMAMEMGKPISEGVGEANKCALVSEYYAQNGEQFLKDEIVELDDKSTKGLVIYKPIGPILAVMPWNFPFWQVIRCAAPIIMAGNTMVLKHASNIPQSAMMIEELFDKAGFPKNVFTTILIGSKPVADVIANSKIAGVTLTGSNIAGKAVAKKSGEMLKKTVMELGGNDPYIILDDADLKKAAELVCKSRFLNAGQTCIAAKRFIVLKEVKDQFLQEVKDVISKIKIGDPLSVDTQMGPMARFDLRDELSQQVQKSIEMGAKCCLGGKFIDGKSGAYYEPTILCNVKKGMPAYDEELFGPVISFIVVDNEDEAVAVANDSIYGLGSGVFGKDIERATRVARKIEAGGTFVNDFLKSDPRLPFGGIKDSGYGRELGVSGIREFSNMKTLVIKEC